MQLTCVTLSKGEILYNILNFFYFLVLDRFINPVFN